ncbi:hypothetical protein J3R82DRAFT_8258 [Butyriboletus roseoflavus]|nr:hypothetical protein J3R82DRAFT_8258 [Butyriboletus roseoflavus]
MSSPSSDPKELDTEHTQGFAKEKGKETAVDNNDTLSPPPDSPIPTTSASLSAGAWQAIFSAQHNAYYFYNASTNETTWVNPLQPSPLDLSSSSNEAQDTAVNAQADGSDGTVDPNPYDPNSLEARAIAAGIDPSLAHLDPSLAGPSSLAHTGSFAAKFNARTGAFTAADARAPAHLSEYERMKRMSEFYFDVGAWEKEVEERDTEEKEGGGKKRKRPTKKDLVSAYMSGFSFSSSSLFACIARDDEFKIGTRHQRTDVLTRIPALSTGTIQGAKTAEKDRQNRVVEDVTLPSRKLSDITMAVFTFTSQIKYLTL